MLNTATTRILGAAVVAFTAITLSGCKTEGCLGGGENCQVAPPCQELSFACSSTDALDVHEIAADEASPTQGSNALASAGDVVLSNGTVRAVISNIGNQNYLDPNGGSLVDLAAREVVDDGSGPQTVYYDAMNQVLTVVGILPGDSVRYESRKLIQEDDRVAVQLEGVLAGNEAVKVYTLYELRRCDQGVRVRTELINTSADNHLWALSDGFYWSKREPIPFTPTDASWRADRDEDVKDNDDEGFVHPSFGLTTINDAFQKFPYMAASLHAQPNSSFAITGCNVPVLEGFNSDTVSSAGLPRTVISPREHQVFERFIAVSPGDDAAAAADVVFEARRQLFDEQYVTVSGKVVRPGDTSFGQDEVSIIIAEEKDGTAATRIPWTQVTPDADGSFSARVPAGRNYRVEVHSFGQLVIERTEEDVEGNRDLGELTLPSTARVRLAVRYPDLFDVPVDAEVFVVPVDAVQHDKALGTFHGMEGACSPWLGPPAGGSPACNRVLVPVEAVLANDGVSIELVPGRYYFYAFRGPFWTIDRKDVEVTATSQDVTLEVRPIPGLKPANALSADFHIHGAASFDSSIPEEDRVLSFSTSDLDVAIATDHEVVYDYNATLERLGRDFLITAVTGLETTGHNPHHYVPGYGFPLVVGHYNFWPLRYDPSLPRNGGVNDEYLEPGQLMDALEGKYTALPIVQLNHPWADPEFGRDLGFPRAILMDTTKDLPAGDDGTRNGVYVRRKDGARNANNAHHAQEVMNGTQNDLLLPYRAFWFYSLNQGLLRTGTANSDSHSLTDNTVGSPRNVVFTTTRAGKDGNGDSRFDADVFNQDVRDGRILGTNGPIITATLDEDGAGPRSFGLTPFKPAADAQLRIRVAAAPWVPVDEIRIVVNGTVRKTIGGADLVNPTADELYGPDSADSASIVRYNAAIAVSELLAGVSGDAWVVVEAGRPLMLAADLGGGLEGTKDGIPDTTDNNADGQVTEADVAEGKAYGPLKNPPLPTTDADPQFHFSQVVHGGYPMAFTNPFVLDLNGNGQFDAPGVQGN